MQEESTFKIKNLRKTGIKKDPVVDGNGEVVQPGSRILKGYWGDWLVFGSKVPGYTLKLKIRITPSGSKIRLINPLMTPDNNWENKRTSVYIDWGDGRYDKFYKKKINSGRFNRNSPYTLEHNYTAQVGDEMWLSITSIEPLVPYGCDIIEMLGQFPYDRYDLNMDRDGHYCGLFGVDQYVEEYPELNKLYGAGHNITKVSADLLDNWRDTGNMNRMFEGWGITEVPTNFFKYSNKFHPDPNPEGIYQRHNMIVDTCTSYYRTFANCPNLVTVSPSILANWQSICETTEEMFDNCPKLQNTINLANNDSWKNASKMYRNCIALENVHESFCIETLSGMETIESIFDGCSKLRTIDWNKFCAKAVNLINAKAAFRGTAFTEVAFNMREMTQLGSIEYMYADMMYLTNVVNSFSYETASKYAYWRHSHPDTLEYAEKKLKISHLFENSGDRTLGMIIPRKYFQTASTTNVTFDKRFPNTQIDDHRQLYYSEKLHLKATHIFSGAYLNKYSDNNKYAPLYDMFNQVFGINGNTTNNDGYNISHTFDGLTCVNCMNFLVLEWIFANCWRIHYMEYMYANIKNRIGQINVPDLLGYSTSLVKSIKGLFKNDIIDYRFSPYNFWGGFSQGDSKVDSGPSNCANYSEMFMGVTYKHNNFPIDHVVNSKLSSIKDYQTVIEMKDMFAGSNIKCYRPISPTSDRNLAYNCTNLVDISSAPKEWMMNGFYDMSNWQPKHIVNPVIYWIELTQNVKTFSFENGYVPKKIDWGDGNTSSSNSHTYVNVGVYRITIIDDVCGQPTKSSTSMIFKLDGELPYGAVFRITDLRAIDKPSQIQEIGRNFPILAKDCSIENATGYVDPLAFRYGSNTELIDGLIDVDIPDPYNIEFEFEADFVLVDKTISMNIVLTPYSLHVGETTTVDLTIGTTRETKHTHSFNLQGSNLMWLPQSYLVMYEINHSNNKFNGIYSNLNTLDFKYLTSMNFAYSSNVLYTPNILNDVNERIMLCNNKIRLHPSINKTKFKNLASIHGTNLTSIWISSDELDFTNDVVDDSFRNTRKPKFTREYVDFELENIPDEDITFFRLDSLPNGQTASRNRQLGKVKIQIFLYNESEDEIDTEKVLEFDGSSLPNIGKIKSENGKAVVRVWSDHIIWPSCCDSIVGIYGILTNKEGDMELHPYDFKFGRRPGNISYKPLAPNLRNVSEDLLWGLTSIYQNFNSLFAYTPIESVPVNLLNNYFGNQLGSMFEGCKNLKVVPDYFIRSGNINVRVMDCSFMFLDCTGIEYVFKPFASNVCCVSAQNMFRNCKTYAFKGYSDLEEQILKDVSITYDTYNLKEKQNTATSISHMVFPADSSIPVLDHDNDTIMAWGLSNPDIAKVATYIPYKNLNLVNYIDNPQMLFRAQFLNYSAINQVYDEPINQDLNINAATFKKMMNSMHGLVSFWVNNAEKTILEPGTTPDHNILFSNTNLANFVLVLNGAFFNYTPNLFFLHQDKIVNASGLLFNVEFDKKPYEEYVPATHLPDRLGRPIYIGGDQIATRRRPRNLDRMLRYRDDFIIINHIMSGVRGDVAFPKLTNHIVCQARYAFSDTSAYVADDTFIDVDREYSFFKKFPHRATDHIFFNNISVKSDCRIFHVWSDVKNYSAGYEFSGTTEFIHPPKDMISNLTNLTTLDHTLHNSNVRDLPDCNPRINNYNYFAASSKLSTIPEHWFKYNGTETLDMRYAFDDCKGLIITHKIIDPTVTVPVLKYSSLRNAWSIIGDDPEIFEGVNTKFDGTDKSLIRVIPETDLFRQTLDIHDNRWTLSVKALGMETIGNESVQDDNLFMVSWGDGSSPSVVSYRNMEWEDYSHKYDAKGRYQVMILSTQWCCYINSPQDLSSKYTTYSIDGMLQNSTCRAVCDTGLTNMFGFTVEKVFPTMFDKLSDVATVKDLPELFFNFNKLKEIPETILHKMASLESIYGFAMYTPITELPAKLLSKNPKLKNANSIAERCYSLITIPSELFKSNPDLETIQRGFCDIQTLTDVPRDLLSNNPNLLNIENMFSHCDNMVIDNTYDNFLANQTKLVNAMHLFRNWTIKQLPPNLLNRCVNLQIVEGMFELQDFNDAGFDSIDDARFNNFFKKMAERDTEFDIPANWLPKSVVNSGTMFFFRTKLKSYPSDLFTGNTVLNKAAYMFMNTAIRRIHNETFKTMSHTHELNLTRWIYKDKRFGKTFYIHYCPKVVSSAINVPSVVTESMLLGVYGTMTEAQLFSGVKTNPSNIHSLYVQEFEPATFKLKMTGDGTFITFKPITKSDVTFTDLTMIEWGDGTDDIFEENIKKADIPKLIKHSYKKPGEYTIKVGAKYCLVPIIDDLPEAYQVNAVVFPENKDTVKQTTIGGEYGIGKVEIKSDRMFVNYHDNTDVEVSLVPRPYYAGETYTVDLIIDKKGLDVGSQTVVELDIVRDTSDPFERLEIGGTLGPMEGYTEFPKVADMPELQYSKWVGTETFFSRNTQLTSFNRSFMNLNYEFRIADKIFWPLAELITMAHCFWNTKLVIEPGFAPDFNKNTKLQSVNSMFRGGRSEDIGTSHSGVIYIPEGTPLNKVIWKVDQTNYQPFASLNSITDYGYICHHSDITYTLTTNLSKISNMAGAYEDARSLTYLRADFFRTLNSSGPISAGSVFTDTSRLTSIQPAPDGKSLLEFTIGNNQTVNFSWTFAGSGLPIDTVVDIINKSSFINTTASGTNIDINNLFSWSSQLQSEDASALKLNIPSRTGTLDLTDLFSYDSDPSTTKYDKDITMLYNIKAGAITVAASGSPNLIVSNMFDHCYADATVSDAHKVFIVAGDDSNFNKAKALADSSALNTLTVMTTTVVPK